MLLTGCGITFNSVTLKDEQLRNTKRIAVVAIAGDQIYYRHQGLINQISKSMDATSFGLDDFYAKRFAVEISRTMGIPTVIYDGPKRESLKNVYSPNAALRANRFNWKTIGEPLSV